MIKTTKSMSGMMMGEFPPGRKWSSWVRSKGIWTD